MSEGPARDSRARKPRKDANSPKTRNAEINQNGPGQTRIRSPRAQISRNAPVDKRCPGFRLAGAEFAEELGELGEGAIQQTLEGASKHSLTLMIFVVNQGATQIHTGIPGTLEQSGDWFNVLDPDFNLHLLPAGIKSAWLVRKRHDLGTNRSVEAHDENGEPIMWIFGKRNQDGTESEKWRDFAESLATSS